MTQQPPTPTHTHRALPPPPYIPPPTHSQTVTLHSHLPLPTSWLCGTCHAPHPILELLTQRIADCACGSPSLRAVYDQFGRIFLYWRDDDPSVSDLRDPVKVEEARGRVWEAGGGGLVGG